MRALFDVNLLIAISDAQHVHYERAHQWWAANRVGGWASCPLTQNGFLRVISQPSYTNPISMPNAMELLAEQIGDTDHMFWSDDISLLDAARGERILGPNQITDVYLLALAVKNSGRLATFDRAIPITAVRDAEPRHVAVL